MNIKGWAFWIFKKIILFVIVFLVSACDGEEGPLPVFLARNTAVPPAISTGFPVRLSTSGSAHIGDIEVANDGSVHTVWASVDSFENGLEDGQALQNARGGFIWYARIDALSGDFGQAIGLADSSSIDFHSSPAVAVDPEGPNVWVVWSENSGVYVRRWDGDTWAAAQQVYSGAAAATTADFRPGGGVAISFTTASYSRMFVTGDMGSFSTTSEMLSGGTDLNGAHITLANGTSVFAMGRTSDVAVSCSSGSLQSFSSIDPAHVSLAGAGTDVLLTWTETNGTTLRQAVSSNSGCSWSVGTIGSAVTGKSLFSAAPAVDPDLCGECEDDGKFWILYVDGEIDTSIDPPYGRKYGAIEFGFADIAATPNWMLNLPGFETPAGEPINYQRLPGYSRLIRAAYNPTIKRGAVLWQQQTGGSTSVYGTLWFPRTMLMPGMGPTATPE